MGRGQALVKIGRASPFCADGAVAGGKAEVGVVRTCRFCVSLRLGAQRRATG